MELDPLRMPRCLTMSEDGREVSDVLEAWHLVEKTSWLAVLVDDQIQQPVPVARSSSN